MKYTVGTQVYSQNTFAGTYRIYEVTKVHKNGNFSIDNGRTQYRPNGQSCGEGHHFVSVLTPEKLEELQAAKAATDRRAAFRIAADKLARVSWKTAISVERLAAIEALTKEMKL